MELRQYIKILWRWWWLIGLSVVIAAVSSFLASKATTPLYSARTTLMVGRVTENPDPNSADLWTGQQLAYTYTQLARREPVLQGAIERLGLNMSWQELAGRVSSNIVTQTLLMEINVVDSDPYRAKVLADAIANELILQSPSAAMTSNSEEVMFIESQMTDLKDKIKISQDEWMQLRLELDAANSARQIQDIQNQINVLEQKIGGWQNTYAQMLASLQGGGINALSIVEEAAIPGGPISPNVRMNVILAAAVGLVLAIGGIFLIEYLDDTVKTQEDVSRSTGLPTLGSIARIEGVDYSEKLIAVHQPLSPVVEAYRALRTNIQFTAVDRQLKTLLMTSPSPSEGKSITVANLAVVIAQSGLQVILVDTDLRRPVQHKIFGIHNRRGLSDAILTPTEKLTDYLQATMVENLSVLPSGSLPPNPAEILGSERMKEVINVLKRHADLILFDSPPALVVADAVILGSRLDGVILVNDVGRTRTPDAARSADELRRVDANLLGVVMNRLSKGSDDYRYYYHYYTEDGTKKRRERRSSWLNQKFAVFKKQDTESQYYKKN